MERVRLTFQEVRWGAEGGPVALLRVGSGDDYLALDLAADEAWALVAAPHHEGAGRIRLGSTLITLLEGAVRACKRCAWWSGRMVSYAPN